MLRAVCFCAFLIASFWTVPFSGTGQSNVDFEPQFVHYNEGLNFEDQDIYHVYYAADGLMWLATNNGVYNYNGKKFNHFTTADGLTDNVVFKFYEDRDEKLWMITHNKKVCYYQKGEFHPYQFNSVIEEKVPCDVILLQMSVGSGNKISFSFNRGGCLEIDAKGNSKHFGNFENEIDNQQYGQHLFKFGTDVLSFSYNRKQLSNIQKVDFYVHNSEHETPKKVTVDYPTTNQVFYSVNYSCRVSNGDLALICRNSVVLIGEEGIEKIELKSAGVFLKEIDSKIWIGTRSGVYSYDLTSKELIHQPYLRDHSITSIEKDNVGGYWFSSLEKGLYYTPSIDLVSAKVMDESTSVSGVKFREGKIIVGCENAGLLSVSRKGEMSKLNQTSQFKNFTRGVEIDSLGNVYTWGAGVYKLTQSGKSKHVDFGEYISKLKLVGEHYYALSKNNLYVVNIETDSVLATIKIDHLDVSRLSANKGDLFLLSEESAYHLNQGRELELLPSVKNCRELWLYNGVLFGVTNNGSILEYVDEKKYSYSEPIFEDLLVNDVLPDDSLIYLATNKGLISTFLNTEKRIVQLDQSDGLAANNIFRMFRVSDTIVYVTKRCLGVVPLPMENHEEKLFIKDIWFESNDKKSVDISRKVTLDENDNEFRIYPEFVSFRQPNDLRLEYQLLGANKGVLYSTDEVLSYSGIRSGEYTFETKLTSNGKNYSPRKFLRITILKPFWKSTQGIVLWILLSVVLVVVVAYYIVGRVKFKEREKRELLEIRSKALSSQMNPHFMFNFLNSIQLKLIKNETEEVAHYLSEFCGLVRKNLDYFTENLISLNEELGLAKSYLELEKLRFKDQVKYEIQVDESLSLKDVKVPPMIIQPFVENAFVHGFSEIRGEGKIMIKLIGNRKEVRIEVDDNGQGLKNNDRLGHKSMGISLIEQRIKLVNPRNNLKIESKKSQGTLVTIRLYT